tara:strand:- start:1162 stop:1836 length:675 start_codon:yes stop_codon:yes gene_type:complete
MTDSPQSHSISDFIANINSTSGFSKANRYEMIILPKTEFATSGVLKQEARDLKFRVASFTVPSKNISTTDTKIYGPVRQAPYVVTYDQLSFSLYLSEGMYEREWFENWMNYVIDYDDNKLNYYNKYTCPIELKVYAPDGFLTQIYKFEGCFPVSIGEIAFSYANEDVAQCQISVSYRKYISRSNNNSDSRPNVASINDLNNVGTQNLHPDDLLNTIKNYFYTVG